MHRHEKGSLSISALWILALLSLLAVGLAKNVLVDFRLNAFALRSAEAAWLARAGVQQAIATLLADTLSAAQGGYDAFSDDWAYNPEKFRAIPLGSGFFEVAYAGPDEPGGPTTRYGILDENRRININKAPPRVLRRLPGMTEEKIAALLDWIDPDEIPREKGAESSDYFAEGAGHGCKNAPVESFDELLLIRGFTRDDVHNLQKLVTFYGDGKININTTTETVLIALGLPAPVAAGIIDARQGEDKVPFTQDDLAFKSPGEIVPALSKVLELGPKEQVILNRLVSGNLLGVTSSFFLIESYGVVLNGKVRHKVRARVQRDAAGTVKILSWWDGRY